MVDPALLCQSLVQFVRFFTRPRSSQDIQLVVEHFPFSLADSEVRLQEMDYGSAHARAVLLRFLMENSFQLGRNVSQSNGLHTVPSSAALLAAL